MGNKNREHPVSWRWDTFTDLPGYVQAGSNHGMGATLITYGYDRQGIDNPGFRQAIKANKNASTPMTVTATRAKADDMDAKLSLTLVPGDPSYQNGRVFYQRTRGFYLGINLPLKVTFHEGVSPLAEADANARRIMQRGFTKRRRQFQGGVVIGELHKTVQMVLKPAKTLQTAVRTHISRTSKLVKRATGTASKKKIIADTYLEATFGWSPLIADVRDGAKALARLVTRDALERQQFRAHGIASSPVSSQHSFVDGPAIIFGAPMRFSVEQATRRDCEVIYYGLYTSKLRRPETAVGLCEDIIAKSGFRFEDWAPTAWELIPWSFFIDYFTNVGDVLEEVANGYTSVAWVTRVIVDSTIKTWDASPDYKGTYDTFILSYPKQWVGFEGLQTHAESELRTVTRNPTGVDLFTRQLRFSLPEGRQWLNIAALALGGKPRQPFY